MVVYVNVDDNSEIISERKFNELREGIPADFDEVIDSGWKLAELVEAFYKSENKDYYQFGKDVFEAIKAEQE